MIIGLFDIFAAARLLLLLFQPLASRSKRLNVILVVLIVILYKTDTFMPLSIDILGISFKYSVCGITLLLLKMVVEFDIGRAVQTAYAFFQRLAFSFYSSQFLIIIT